ncbi:hypothetical protein ACLOAV_006994 [Pseudogymnoascus australis]
MPANDTYSQLRFRVEVNAPTAVINLASDMRAKSFNISQAYSMSIVDTAPESAATLYRTSVWISLDYQQLQNPETFWHLRSSGAEGLVQREDNLRAVELIQKSSQGLLEKEFFDGFSVIWTPETNGCVVCNIVVRFNFLPIDFSHCRGAKCVPVRLYADTEVLNTGQNEGRAADRIHELDFEPRSGGNQVRSWMNGTVAASTTISRTKPNSVVTSSTGGNNRSKPNTTTTILPSPIPSNEPSPAQESVGRMAPVTKRGMDMQAEELVVQSPEGQEEPMMGQQGQTNNEPQAARTPETMKSPMIIEQGHTPVETGEVQSPGMLQSLMMMGQRRNTPTETQAVRSPSTQTVRSPSAQQPSRMIQQRNTPTEAQVVQSQSTQQPHSMVQQGNMPTSAEQAHFLANRRPLLMNQRGQVNYRPQEVQSPTTQQPPPTVQQGHAITAPQPVQSPRVSGV